MTGCPYPWIFELEQVIFFEKKYHMNSLEAEGKR